MRNVILKELLRRWRSPASTIGLLLFPFLMAGMIGAVSSGGGSQFPVIEVLILNRDDGMVSDLLLGTLTDGPAQEYVSATEVGEEGFAQMESGDASALIIFPAGMSDAVLEGREVQIELVRNPSEGIKPEVVQQGLEVLATYLDEAAKLMGEELDQLLTLFDGTGFPGASQILSVSGALIERVAAYEAFIFPPLVWLESTKEETEGAGPGINVFGYVLVMVSVMSVLFAASRAILDLYDEEKTGMLRRQLGAPISVSWLVNGKIVFAVVFAEVLTLILLGMGTALGWLTLPVNFLGLLLLTTAFAVAASGLMAIIYAFCRTDKAAAGANWVVIMGMSVLGGSMTPTDVFPPALQQLSRFTLNYWAIQGMNDLLIFKEAWTGILPNLAVLGIFSAVSLPVAHVLMQRKFQKELP